ncbi:MAG TPA: acyl-CoA dehydrogenase family protein [Methylomirabilota bacterium]|nr:acyl-CoA dehydrogenase family protein [Methylomirabilota bacterium]
MVNFQPTEEQQLIQQTVASFAREQMRPAARDADESGQIPNALVQQAWELGLVQSTIPETLGGMGEAPSAVTGVLVYEELAWADLAIALHILTPRLVIQPVLALGNQEQQQQVLPAYTGAAFTPGTAAVMEPRFRFDINELTTTATREHDGYILNGTKCYVPLAAEAQHLLVYARSEEGLTAFLVPPGTPGLTVHGREKNMGLKALATYELTLERCRVPAAARLAGNLAPFLNRSRVALAALAVGVARAAFEYARDYAKERRAFGTAIAQKQAIAFLLAEMATEIDAARLLTWEAAWKIDAGRDTPLDSTVSGATREACLAKNYAANMALKVTDNAVQILGGHGYIRDHPVELWLRNARGFAVFEGLAIV